MESLDSFLAQVARRGSWLGGGSVAALTAALAAALLEKLIVQPAMRRQLRSIRLECSRLIRRDAETFARVVNATRTSRRSGFARALKQAIDVPCRVFERACAIQAACRSAQRLVKPQLQSDLKCAMALAEAAGTSAHVLIRTNLAWLNDARYAKDVKRRLDVCQRYARSASR